MARKGQEGGKGRRDKGTGALYFSKQRNCWMGSFYLPSGERKYISGKVGGTKREAREKLEQAMREAESGTLVDYSAQTVEQFAGTWLAERRLSMKPSQYQSWQSLMKCHIVPDLGQWQLQKISREIVQRCITSWYEEDELSGSTVHLLYEVTSLLFKDGVAQGKLRASPCKQIRLPRISDLEMQFLDPGQARTLLAHLHDSSHKHEALIMLAITTGLRQGECLALRWSDIDFDNKRVHVRRTVTHINGEGYIETDPKTKASRRSVSLTEQMIQALHKHHARQLADHLRLRIKNEKDLVFCGRGGSYFSTTALTVMFKKVLQVAGLPAIRWHDLRHTAATLLLRSGANIKEVQRILGHTDIQTTMRYLHVLPEMEEQAIARLGNLLFA